MTQDADFDSMIQRHLTRVHKLRAIQQMIAEDPEIVPELLMILSNPAGVTPIVPQPEVRRRTDGAIQVQKLVAYFRGNGNTAMTVQQIAKDTGLTRNMVNAVLYNEKNRPTFKRLKVGLKRVLWRLREDESDEDGEMTVEELHEAGFDEKDFGDSDDEPPDQEGAGK